MPVNIIMPALSPTMKEGSVANWIVKVGDKVKEGDIIAEAETDKALMEIEALDGGKLGKILFEAGSENVEVGQVIGVLLKEGEDEKDLESYLKKEGLLDTSKKTPHPNSNPQMTNNSTDFLDATVKNPNFSENHLNDNFRIKSNAIEEGITAKKTDLLFKKPSTPLARKIAKFRNINIDDVYGSGPNNRVTKTDVELFNCNESQGYSGSYSKKTLNKPDQVIELSQMRKTISRRMLESKQNIPHCYLSTECEISELLKMRKDFNENVEDESAYVSINDAIIKAISIALVSCPNMNASFEDNKILLHGSIDICVAVSITGGLVAPKICDVANKNILEIAKETKNIVKRAKEHKLSPEELKNGSISLSNTGKMGADKIFPIINVPQVAIVGVGQVLKKPAFDKDKNLFCGEFINVVVSADHRAVDGSDVARFLKAINNTLSKPIKIFSLM